MALYRCGSPGEAGFPCIEEGQVLYMGSGASGNGTFLTPDNFTKGTKFSKTVKCFRLYVMINAKGCNSWTLGYTPSGTMSYWYFKSDGTVLYVNGWQIKATDYDLTDIDYILFARSGSTSETVNVTVSFTMN